jgi:hypothetical protein
MGAFIYRCPARGFNVQGFASDHPAPVPASIESVYEAVTCTACRRVHLVNAKSGQVLGAGSRSEFPIARQRS